MSYSHYPSSINNHDAEAEAHFVACSATGRVRTFGTARGLALFMDERPLADWSLFKWREGWRRVQVAHSAVTTDELRKAIQQA